MTSQDFIPIVPLREYIKVIRLRHFFIGSDVSLHCKPFPPRPEQCLIFYPAGYEIVENASTRQSWVRKGAVLAGQYTDRLNRHLVPGEFLMVEVDLQPGALNRLTRIPFHELLNRDIDAEAVFPAVRMVCSRLADTRSYREMLGIIEAFFMELLADVRYPMLAVDHQLLSIAASLHMVSLDDLAKHCYLSPRQLERKFDERIGIGPMTFLRLCRFNRSYWMHLKDPGLNWLSIAFECGYTDYQHLVKDYKAFAETTPIKFFAEEQKAPGRMLGLTK